MSVKAKHVDTSNFDSDIVARYTYLAEFIGFTADDIATIKSTAPIVGPLVPAIVDTVYSKLFGFDATKRYFVPRQAGYNGDVPADLDHLDLNHPQIKFRKMMLGRYLTKVVTSEYDGKFLEYIDWVGKIHTTKGGNSRINVDLVHMNALIGASVE
eukprot:TRINITY_DN220_c0_g1_i1.p2 TRINITY_DN220_c0_g1~~TRINITY_DN220_c0_g1_i1.p2  ORF type:complete len:155 (-),score=68.33 TRINITY_DN220_c0_g1_i1:67-531(-)